MSDFPSQPQDPKQASETQGNEDKTIAMDISQLPFDVLMDDADLEQLQAQSEETQAIDLAALNLDLPDPTEAYGEPSLSAPAAQPLIRRSQGHAEGQASLADRAPMDPKDHIPTRKLDQNNNQPISTRFLGDIAFLLQADSREQHGEIIDQSQKKRGLRNLVFTAAGALLLMTLSLLVS